MNCPYCQSQLEKTSHHKTFHCPNCRGNWLDSQSIAKLEKKTITQLEDQAPQSDINPPQNLRCPVCQERLSLIRPNKDSQLWTCPQGHGNFFPHQHLKHYHRHKQSPFSLAPLLGVLIPTLLVLSLIIAVPLTIKRITSPQTHSQTTQATSTISTPQITQVPPRSLIISFNTSQPATAKLNLYQNLPNQNKQPPLYTYSVSDQFTRQHRVTLNNLKPNQTYYFTITVTDSQGSTTTDPQTLTLDL